MKYVDVLRVELEFIRYMNYPKFQNDITPTGLGLLKRLYAQWGITLKANSTMPVEVTVIDDGAFVVWETFILLLIEVYK